MTTNESDAALEAKLRIWSCSPTIEPTIESRCDDRQWARNVRQVALQNSETETRYARVISKGVIGHSFDATAL
jgi:hypothetical protein